MVSVVMPSLNSAEYIEKAIDSVAEQTTTEPIELIVVDNGSRDGTYRKVLSKQKEWEAKYGEHRRIVIKQNPERGVAGSRNMGMGSAEGQYIAFLDSDDWWDVTKLEKQLSVMAEDPDCVLCSTGRELVNADGSATGRCIGVKEYITLKDMEKQNWINCSSVLLDRETAIRYPMEHDDSHEDYIMWLRILKECRYARAIDEPLLKCRQSRDGKSRNKWKSAKMTWKVYRYVGYSFPKSVWCLLCYMTAGLKKYYG